MLGTGATLLNLYAIRQQRTRVDQLRERIECIQADLERITKVSRNLPTTGAATDRLSAKVAKLVDFKAQLADEVVALEVGIRAAEGVLDKLPAQQQRIMRLRYVDGLSWQRVARRIQCSRQNCWKLHEDAIKHIANGERGAS